MVDERVGSSAYVKVATKVEKTVLAAVVVMAIWPVVA